MTTADVPEPTQPSDRPGRLPAGRGTSSRARAVEPAVTGALLLLALTVLLAVWAVPMTPLVTVALLLPLSVGVLAVGAREDRVLLRGESPEVPADEAPETQGVYYYDQHGRPVPIDDAF